MSELNIRQLKIARLRSDLMVGASLLAILGAILACQPVIADEQKADGPNVWIELGGQVERVDSAHSVLIPLFISQSTSANRLPMIDAQRPSRYSLGGEGKISFIPKNSDWQISASIRYGRSGNDRHLHHQSPLPFSYRYFGNQVFSPLGFEQFGDGQSNFKESHFVLDFQAGRDLGIGLFGDRAESMVSIGLRYAQFTNKSDATLHARPEYRFG